MAGLLDDMPKSAEDALAALRSGTEMMRDYFKRHPASPEEERRRQGYLKGETPAMMLDITKGEREALLAQGMRCLQLNQLDEAKDWLSFCIVLDPLEERALYGLSMIAQMRGDLKNAARGYIQFLALDATNPNGHLRLGECFLANREFDKAEACFLLAEKLCERNNNAPAALQHARHMLDVLRQQAPLTH